MCCAMFQPKIARAKLNLGIKDRKGSFLVLECEYDYSLLANASGYLDYISGQPPLWFSQLDVTFGSLLAHVLYCLDPEDP